MSDRSYATARLDELGPLAWSEDKLVQLVRLHFGIESFGVNVWTAGAQGGPVIDEHDEEGSGAGRQEELYVVLSGRARFSVGADEFDAGPGTFVFVRDPAAKRGATALEEGTSILVVGGVPGQAYRPSPWELAAPATAALRAGDYEEGRRILAERLAEDPENPSVLYNLACAEALLGRRQDALEHLAAATAKRADLAVHAQTDEDFESIRDDPAFPAPGSAQ